MQKRSEQELLDGMVTRYPDLKDVQADVRRAFEVMRDCFQSGGKLLICGNGGSAADSDHIAGELLKSMELKRPITTAQRKALVDRYSAEGEWIADRLMQALPAISLLGHPGLLSAMDNDVSSEMAYAQQVFAYGKPGDVLLAISTSGKATNVKHAMRVAHSLGMHIIGLTGSTPSEFNDLCDVAICAPGTLTVDVQERHLPIYHTLCRLLENHFFD